MGKGDKKSKKGKIFKGSFGVSRSRITKKTATVSKKAEAAPAAEAPKKRTVKKKTDA